MTDRITLLSLEQQTRADALDRARDACSSYRQSDLCNQTRETVTRLHADAHHLMLVAQWILGEIDGGDDVQDTPSEPIAETETLFDPARWDDSFVTNQEPAGKLAS